VPKPDIKIARLGGKFIFHRLSGARGQDHGAGLLPARHAGAGRVDPGAEQDHQAESEGHIYDVLNMSLVVPWRRGE